MQSGGSRADGDHVAARAAMHVGHPVSVRAVDVERIRAGAEVDVHCLDRARNGFDGILDVARRVVDGGGISARADVVARPEHVVMDAHLVVGAHAHAGHADGGELAGRPGCVAVDVQGIRTPFAHEGDDAADVASDGGRAAARVQHIVAGAAIDVCGDVRRHAVHLDRIVEAAQFHAQRRAFGSGIGDRVGHAETAYRAQAECAADRARAGIRAQENAVARALVAAGTRIDDQSAQVREVARKKRQRSDVVIVEPPAHEQRLGGVARGVEAVCSGIALEGGRGACHGGHAADENAIVGFVAAHRGGVAGVDAIEGVDLDEVEIASAGNFDGRGLDVTLDVDGCADVGIAVRDLGVPKDMHRCPAADQRSRREVHIVAGAHRDIERRRNESAGDGHAELCSAAGQQIQVFILARGVIDRQPHRARHGSDLQHIQRRAHFRHVHVLLRVDEQAPDAGHCLVDLQRVLLLADARAVYLHVVAGRADAATRDNVDVPALDIGFLVVVRVEHRSAQRDQHDVRFLRRNAAQVQVTRNLAQVYAVVCQGIDFPGRLLRGVDFQKVADVADRAKCGAQIHAVADDPRGCAVVANTGDLVDRSGQRLERYIAAIRSNAVDAQITRGFRNVDIAVGQRMDIPGPKHVGVRAHVNRRRGKARRGVDHDHVAPGNQVAEVVAGTDRRSLAGVGVDRRIELRRRADFGPEMVHVAGEGGFLRHRELDAPHHADRIGFLHRGAQQQIDVSTARDGAGGERGIVGIGVAQASRHIKINVSGRGRGQTGRPAEAVRRIDAAHQFDVQPVRGGAELRAGQHQVIRADCARGGVANLAAIIQNDSQAGGIVDQSLDDDVRGAFVVDDRQIGRSGGIRDVELSGHHLCIKGDLAGRVRVARCHIVETQFFARQIGDGDRVVGGLDTRGSTRAGDLGIRGGLAVLRGDRIRLDQRSPCDVEVAKVADRDGRTSGRHGAVDVVSDQGRPRDAVHGEAAHGFGYAPVLVDGEHRIRPDEQHDIAVETDVAPGLEFTMLRVALAAQRAAVGARAALPARHDLLGPNRDVVRGNAGAIVDVDRGTALIIGGRRRAGVAVQAIRIRIGPGRQIDAFVTRYQVDVVALDPCAGIQQYVGNIVHGHACARTRAGNRRRGIGLGLRTRLHAGHDRLQGDVRAFQPRVRADLRAGDPVYGDIGVGVRIRAQAGGIGARTGFAFERTARFCAQRVFREHLHAAANLHLRIVTQRRTHGRIAEADRTAAARLRQDIGFLGCRGENGDVIARRDRTAVADIDIARGAHGCARIGRADRHKSAAAVG